MQEARYARLYADDRGESHFGDVDLGLTPVDFAPPAPPLNLAPLFPVSRCFLLGGPADWAGDTWHPTPRRQLFCVLQGELDVMTSDGQTRRFAPGGVVLLEDTTGAGHATRAVDGREFLLLGVALSD